VNNAFFEIFKKKILFTLQWSHAPLLVLMSRREAANAASQKPVAHHSYQWVP